MTDQITIEPLDDSQFAPYAEAAASIYGAAMRRVPEVVIQRRDIIRSHLRHVGFIATVALDPDGNLVGFGYGYRGVPGQWWYDAVSAALDREDARRWLQDGFELAELHVQPEHQRGGIGSQLLDDLTDRANAANVLLSTPDDETPARRLYRSRGFVDLLTNFYFPGSSEAYAVMGCARSG